MTCWSLSSPPPLLFPRSGTNRCWTKPRTTKGGSLAQDCGSNLWKLIQKFFWQWLIWFGYQNNTSTIVILYVLIKGCCWLPLLSHSLVSTFLAATASSVAVHLKRDVALISQVVASYFKYVSCVPKYHNQVLHLRDDQQRVVTNRPKTKVWPNFKICIRQH